MGARAPGRSVGFFRQIRSSDLSGSTNRSSNIRPGKHEIRLWAAGLTEVQTSDHPDTKFRFEWRQLTEVRSKDQADMNFMLTWSTNRSSDLVVTINRSSVFHKIQNQLKNTVSVIAAVAVVQCIKPVEKVVPFFASEGHFGEWDFTDSDHNIHIGR